MLNLIILFINILILSGCATIHNGDKLQAKNMSINDIQSCNKHHKIVEGLASIYSRKFEGRRMANGKVFHTSKNTVASVVFPINAKLKITNLENHIHVYAVNSDKMNPEMLHKDRVVDLSPHLAKYLKIHAGLTKVSVEIVCGN
jgi:rare lipoprotein A